MAKWLRTVLLLTPLAAVALLLVVLGVGMLLPRTFVTAESARYRQPPPVVWAAMTDLAALPAWDPLVQRMERRPDRHGHPVWREHNGDGAVTYEVVQAVPPHRLVLRVLANDAPFRGTWTFDLAPGPPGEGGSQLTLTARGRIANPFFRFLLRFVYGSDRALDIYLTALGRRLGETVQPFTAR
ncbi:MAG TPA: SRPBCC family protein [Thermoanaerobaculia bacterium]|nr:SRPBCC family protein [Thermoanaerobaculia bacterium]